MRGGLGARIVQERGLGTRLPMPCSSLCVLATGVVCLCWWFWVVSLYSVCLVVGWRYFALRPYKG